MTAVNNTGPEPPDVETPSANSADDRLPFANCIRWMVIGEKTVAALFLFIIVTTMAAQVFARYVFGTPFPWSEEVARLALIWLTYISAAFVIAERRHITVDMISSRVGDGGKLIVECVSNLVVTISCLLLLIGGAKFVWFVGKVGSPALGVSKTWWYGAGMVGLLLMAVHSLLNLLQVCITGKVIPRVNDVEEEAFHLEMEPGE